MNYGQHYNQKRTPQSEPIPGSKQVQNSAGGYSFQVDEWTRLDRFLILGTEGGSYYATERKLTIQSGNAVRACISTDGLRTVKRIVEISDAGRAAKNDPAIFALAMCAKLGNEATRKAAYAALPKVCRTGTHLMHFAEYAQGFGGWGRGMRNAVGRWYNDKEAKDVAYQVIKYQSRDSWSNRDLLRLSHPTPRSEEHAAIYHWVTKGEGPKSEWKTGSAVETMWAFDQLKKTTTAKDAVKLITKYRLPRECVPTELLNNVNVWSALLPHMGITALIRNLATMTRVGLIAPFSDATNKIVETLGDEEKLKKGRVHPIAILAALTTYASGRSARGSATWSPNQNIVNALDGAFYKAFANVEPTGKNTLLALDISGSMDGGECAGVPGLTPRIGAAAMALMTAATEKNHHFIGFTSGGDHIHVRANNSSLFTPYSRGGVTELSISPKQRLDDVVKYCQRLPMGGTDCSLPILWARQKKLPVETFVVYTDNETWAGSIHPAQALQSYRRETGINAKLIVVGMVANDFTIADPNDAGMLDVVGFDTNAPVIMADFAR